MDWKKPISRRHFLHTLGALGSMAGADAFLVEPNRIDVSRHKLGSGSSAVPPLRIVQLTDLHLHGVGRHERRTAERVAELQPDLVVITGDTIDELSRVEDIESFLGLLPATPRYAVQGNREYRQDAIHLDRVREAFTRSNARLLVNETVVHRHHGKEVLVTGLDDLLQGTPDLGRALRGIEPRTNHIVLCHCPGYRDLLAAAMPDGFYRIGQRQFPIGCMLSGHTHGGQVAPFLNILPPGSGRYRSGWYRDRLPHLYVSRGVGTTHVPARFLCPPEISCFDWTLAA